MIIAVGAHPGIIPGADWVKAQKLLAQNKSKSYHKPKSHQALFSGLLYCGACGAYMRPKRSQRVNDKGELVYAYLCAKKERSNGMLCDMPRPNGNTLDALVCEELKRIAGNPQALAHGLERHKQRLAGRGGEYAHKLAAAQACPYPEEEIAVLAGILASFAGTFDRMAVEEKRQALRRLVRRVEYHRNDELRISFFGDACEPNGEDCK